MIEKCRIQLDELKERELWTKKERQLFDYYYNKFEGRSFDEKMS